jgi:hypothetical protein
MRAIYEMASTLTSASGLMQMTLPHMPPEAKRLIAGYIL